jgi:hypothetical protein
MQTTNTKHPIKLTSPYEAYHQTVEHRYLNEHFVVRKSDGAMILEFIRANYPACCGINILHSFYCNSHLNVNFEEIVNEIFDNTIGYWKNKTQFVAVKENVKEWGEDEEGYETIISTRQSETYNYNKFVVALIKRTKAKLISEFLNSNSNNTCFVYEFDGENL